MANAAEIRGEGCGRLEKVVPSRKSFVVIKEYSDCQGGSEGGCEEMVAGRMYYLKKLVLKGSRETSKKG